jgi:hypothetical protein
VRVFLDECVDRRLAREITGHEVRTARQEGWTGIANSQLLALVSQSFDVFVTVDRNLSFQQNLPSFSIAVIVLHATSNRLAELRVLIPELSKAIESAPVGVATIVRATR